MLSFFAHIFLKVLDMVEFIMQNEFSAVFFSLHRWNKTTVFLVTARLYFFLSNVTSTPLRQQRMCRRKTLLTMSYVLT